MKAALSLIFETIFRTQHLGGNLVLSFCSISIERGRALAVDFSSSRASLLRFEACASLIPVHLSTMLSLLDYSTCTSPTPFVPRPGCKRYGGRWYSTLSQRGLLLARVHGDDALAVSRPGRSRFKTRGTRYLGTLSLSPFYKFRHHLQHCARP